MNDQVDDEDDEDEEEGAGLQKNIKRLDKNLYKQISKQPHLLKVNFELPKKSAIEEEELFVAKEVEVVEAESEQKVKTPAMNKEYYYLNYHRP